MPFYRFLVHGVDPRVPDGARGFCTTRHAWAETEDRARAKVLRRLEREFTSGRSSRIWQSAAPWMTVEKGWRIGWGQAWSAPNRGSAFYDERE
jgi:hypothetical protein